jgi:hypothetical protein
LNITYPDPINLSGKNLSVLLTTGTTVRSVWFNNSVGENASFSYATGLTDFNVTVNGEAVPSSWFGNASGVISGTTNVTGRYEFFDSACDQYGCVLGEFWVEDESGLTSGQHLFIYPIADKNTFGYVKNLDGSYNIFSHGELDSYSYTNKLSNIYYYKGDLYNNGNQEEVTN